MDDVICIIKKDQVDILFNHINNMDDHMKFTVEFPDNEGHSPFLDTKCTPNPNHTIHTTVYRKLTHTDRYLDLNSNHPISAKRSVIQALTHRAKIGPELLAKEMDCLNKVLSRNSFPDWLLKNQTTGLIKTKSPTKKPQRNPLSQSFMPRD